MINLINNIMNYSLMKKIKAEILIFSFKIHEKNSIYLTNI